MKAIQLIQDLEAELLRLETLFFTENREYELNEIRELKKAWREAYISREVRHVARLENN